MKDFTINTVLPAAVGGLFGLLGSPLVAAVFFGVVTKLFLWFFHDEIKAIGIYLRKKVNKLFKKKEK